MEVEGIASKTNTRGDKGYNGKGDKKGEGTLMKRLYASVFSRVVIFSFSLSGFAGLCMGYSIGMNVGLLPFLEKHWGLSVFEQSLVAASYVLGAMTGSLSGSVLADALGRRFTLLMVASYGFLTMFATILSTEIFSMLALRLLHGTSVGLLSFVSPLLVGEIAPTSVRGSAITFFQLSLTFGILLGNAAAFVFQSFIFDWQALVLVNAIFNALLFLTAALVAESPRFYMKAGKKEAAKKSMRFLYPSMLEEERNAEIRKMEAAFTKKSIVGMLSIIPLSWQQIILALLLAVAQQLSGINAIMFFAPNIMEASGLSKGPAALAASVGIGTWNFLTTFSAVFLVDRLGRRPLMIYALIGMSMGNFGLFTAFSIPGLVPPFLSIIAITSVLLYVGSFELGPGPLFFTLGSEIFPAEIRGLSLGIMNLIQWSCNLLVVLFFRSAADFLGMNWTYFVFFVFTFLSLVLEILVLPETKGRSLEEITLRYRQAIFFLRWWYFRKNNLDENGKDEFQEAQIVGVTNDSELVDGIRMTKVNLESEV